MTFEIFEGKDIKIDFQKDKISFSGVQSEGEQKYEVELELFDEVVPEVRWFETVPFFIQM